MMGHVFKKEVGTYFSTPFGFVFMGIFLLLSGKLLADAFACSDSHSAILRRYKKNTLGLRLKLYGKTFKRSILCSPTLRHCIMKSGIMSVKKYEKK